MTHHLHQRGARLSRPLLTVEKEYLFQVILFFLNHIDVSICGSTYSWQARSALRDLKSVIDTPTHLVGSPIPTGQPA